MHTLTKFTPPTPVLPRLPGPTPQRHPDPLEQMRLDDRADWALLKLVTGALRIGVSARLAKTAVATLGGRDPQEIEDLWPMLVPPYTSLLTWLDGKGPRPEAKNSLRFFPPMLARGRGREFLAPVAGLHDEEACQSVEVAPSLVIPDVGPLTAHHDGHVALARLID